MCRGHRCRLGPCVGVGAIGVAQGPVGVTALGTRQQGMLTPPQGLHSTL